MATHVDISPDPRPLHLGGSVRVNPVLRPLPTLRSVRGAAVPSSSKAWRRTSLVGAALLLLIAVAACGNGDAAGEGPVGLDAVEISGDVGSEPQVDLAAGMTADGLQTETVVDGEGPALAEGDSVLVNYWLGNGFDQEVSQQSFGPQSAGGLATVGAAPAQPATVDDVLSAAAAKLVEEGATVGSRVVATGSAQEVLGLPGVPELGIGNLDPVVLVVDLVDQPLSEPSGPKVDPPSWVPGLRIADDVPTSWTFANTPEPTDELRSFTRIVGEGEKVAKGDEIVVNYLGQVYGGEKPFDESYSSGAPIGFGIGLGRVIEGWDQALVGVPVGSRVVFAIPPDLGYGEQGSPQAGINGDDTLYFVIDVLGAA